METKIKSAGNQGCCCCVTTVGIVFLVVATILYLLRLRNKGPNFSSHNTKRLDGKVVVITGANTGIGKETAENLYKRGARVIMLCRSLDRANEAIKDIKTRTQEEGKNGSLEVEQMDLSSLESIRACAKRLLAKEDKIDILINNAGISFKTQSKTVDGFDMTFGTNHFGHFLLTELLLPLVKKAVIGDPSDPKAFRPRIVIVSALAHEHGFGINWDDIHWEGSGYNFWSCYASSKLANIMHCKALARRLGGSGVSVYSLHPGVIITELARDFEEKYFLFRVMRKLASLILKTPFDGAQTTLYCALDESIRDQSGRYYSDCREVMPHRWALDVDDQERLWKISEEAVGLAKKS